MEGPDEFPTHPASPGQVRAPSVTWYIPPATWSMAAHATPLQTPKTDQTRQDNIMQCDNKMKSSLLI